MIYEYENYKIDLNKITRLYPAAMIELDGDVAEMSLEWMDTNEGKVTLQNYILVFDFTPPNQEIKDRVVLNFSTRDNLVVAMNDVSKFF